MKIEGLKESSKALDELEKKVAKSITRKALRAGANIVKAACRAEAPVQTGTTQKSIKVRGGKSGNGFVGLTVATSAKDYVGKVFYISFVEYGHRVGARRLGDSRKMVPANPFMERGFDVSKENAVEVVASTLTELIEAEANK